MRATLGAVCRGRGDDEGDNQVHTHRKSLLGRGKSKGQGPEVDLCAAV